MCIDFCQNFFNPDLHSPLKLLNNYGIDGKTWFKEQGLLWVYEHGNRVVSRVLLCFSHRTMSHVPPLTTAVLQTWETPTTLCFILTYLELSDP